MRFVQARAKTISMMIVLGGVALATTLAGCTRNASSEWAQTAPVIKADATIGQPVVNLGAR